MGEFYFQILISVKFSILHIVSVLLKSYLQAWPFCIVGINCG